MADIQEVCSHFGFFSGQFIHSKTPQKTIYSHLHQTSKQHMQSKMVKSQSFFQITKCYTKNFYAINFCLGTVISGTIDRQSNDKIYKSITPYFHFPKSINANILHDINFSSHASVFDCISYYPCFVLIYVQAHIFVCFLFYVCCLCFSQIDYFVVK